MIDRQALEHIAHLARLKLGEQEKEKLSEQLAQIIKYFDQIAKVNTDGVEPLITPTEVEAIWRVDEAQQKYTPEEILSNAPEKTGNLFTVPPVV